MFFIKWLEKKGGYMTAKTKVIIILLSVGIVVCLGVMLWAVFFRTPQSPIIPDYAPESTEKNVEPIPGGNNETKIDTPQGGGAIGIEYVSEVIVDLSDKMVYLQYSNPAKSTQNTVLRIEIQNEVIAQSGLITPGNQLKKLSLAEGMSSKLEKGGYNAQFRILSYDPITGEKSMVDTIAKITVIVRD